MHTTLRTLVGCRCKRFGAAHARNPHIVLFTGPIMSPTLQTIRQCFQRDVSIRFDDDFGWSPVYGSQPPTRPSPRTTPTLRMYMRCFLKRFALKAPVGCSLEGQSRTPPFKSAKNVANGKCWMLDYFWAHIFYFCMGPKRGPINA